MHRDADLLGLTSEEAFQNRAEQEKPISFRNSVREGDDKNEVEIR
jgi:hypothetical protein